MKNIVQQSPFTILVEPTEGCNLGCSFCGLRGMRKSGTKPWYFMSLETVERIASEIARVNWRSKIVFGNHGEPTLNPQLTTIIDIFRKHLPKNIFHIYTNGYAANNAEDTNEYIDSLFNAGIDNIIVDCYSDDGDWRFVDKLKQKDDVEIVNYGLLKPLYTKNHKKRILLVSSIKDDTRITRRLANHCGAAAPLDNSYNDKRCAMPFRELVFRYDGNVSLCCDDFRGEYPIANIHDKDIISLWNDEKFVAARIMLYNHSRDFRPCRGCTNISMRVGFLPDSSGQETLPPITSEVKKIAQEVSKKGFLSKIIVKRKWEK